MKEERKQQIRKRIAKVLTDDAVDVVCMSDAVMIPTAAVFQTTAVVQMKSNPTSYRAKTCKEETCHVSPSGAVYLTTRCWGLK